MADTPHRTLSISIHALREESDPLLSAPGSVGAISIHALREESDTVSDGQQFKLQFQSTLFVRRATALAVI